jgi:hypothetical protein
VLYVLVFLISSSRKFHKEIPLLINTVYIYGKNHEKIMKNHEKSYRKS